jgi:iron-sulfur cluster repair protein YtfE (RIC family)
VSDAVPARPTAALDEATRPTARLGVVLSPAQQLAGGHLRQIHDVFRAELAALEARVGEVRRGEAAASEVRTAVSQLAAALGAAHGMTLAEHCSQLCRFVTMHHTLEDSAMFPALGAHAKVKPVVDRLTEEHVVIHEHLEYVDALAARLDGDEAAVLSELESAVATFATVLRSHFTYEETELAEPLGLLGLG